MKLESNKRDVKVNDIIVPPVVKVPEPKKKAPNSLFGPPKPKPEIKSESTSPSSSKDVKSVQSVKSPKKESPKKNQSAAKVTKQPQGKSSIATFFNKPTSSSSNKKPQDKSVAEATVKIEQVKLKEEPETSNGTANASKNPHKRNLSNASGKQTNLYPFEANLISTFSDSNEERKNGKSDKSDSKDASKPSKKKIKLEAKGARSRLMQICDSSSDEDESTKSDSKMVVDEEVPVKKEKENKTPSPKKEQNGKSNSNGTTKRRIKVKKMVTRTYEDEDGFISKFNRQL